jgi:phage head maturation protease
VTIIAPGAFKKATRDMSRVRLLRDHNRDTSSRRGLQALGKTDGLYVSGFFAKTDLGGEVAELAVSVRSRS